MEVLFVVVQEQQQPERRTLATPAPCANGSFCYTKAVRELAGKHPNRSDHKIHFFNPFCVSIPATPRASERRHASRVDVRWPCVSSVVDICTGKILINKGRVVCW